MKIKIIDFRTFDICIYIYIFFLAVKDLTRLHNLDMVTRRAVIEKKTITLSLPPRLQTGSSQLLEPQSP